MSYPIFSEGRLVLLVEGLGSEGHAHSIDVPLALVGLRVGPEHHPDLVSLALTQLVKLLKGPML